MRSILIYVAPEAKNLPMVQAAADLVEALTFDPEAPNHSASVLIGLVAEPSVCLEVGLAMLGRGEARTVEGGERVASPLTLFPYVTEEGRKRGELNLLRRERAEKAEFGTLADLLDFGAAEAGMNFSWERHANANANDALEDAAMHARVQRSWQHIVVFSPDGVGPVTLHHLPGAKVVTASDFSGEGEGFHALLKQLGPEQDEMLGQQRREAVAAALAFEKVLKPFLKDESPGRAQTE